MNRILSDGERICWYLYGNSAWCGYMCVMLVSPPLPLQLDLLLLKPAMRDHRFPYHLILQLALPAMATQRLASFPLLSVKAT
jgi:hypothetical protein